MSKARGESEGEQQVAAPVQKCRRCIRGWACTFEEPFLAPGELCSSTARGFSTARLRRPRTWADVAVLGSICTQARFDWWDSQGDRGAHRMRDGNAATCWQQEVRVRA